MNTRSLVAFFLCLLGVGGVAPLAHAAPVSGPEINPFACQGDADAAQDDRSIGQVQMELEKKLDPLFESGDEPTVRAKKLCVVARLKARVGQGDAIEYFDRAIAENPDEPGYYMFAGEYYGGARGAKLPVTELAEKYYYQALKKLEELKASGRYRDFHAIVEDHVRKDMLLLYQQDGLPLLPWKAFRQHSGAYQVPAVSLSDQFYISRDTRAELGGNDTGGFTAEAGLFKQPTRRGVDPSPADLYRIARQPLRMENDAFLNFRQPYVGEISLFYGWLHDKDAAITNFGDTTKLNDIDVTQEMLEFKRVIPLYPLFDFKLDVKASEVQRTGVVEDLPNCEQDFPVYEFKPAISRFISSDKLTVGGTYVYMGIKPIDCPGVQVGTPPYLLVRGRTITAVNLEYAIYSPLVLPSLQLGSLRPYRTPTRGLYLTGGYVNDNEVFGDHRVINETFFGGARLEGPGPYDISLNETFNKSSGTVVDPMSGVEIPSNDLSAKILRSGITITRRLINPDETPGVPNSVGPFANHSLNWVFPASIDNVLSDYKKFENFRVGTQLWWQVFGTGLWGATFLTTIGYDYEYFYRINKNTHNVFLTARLGWRDL
jgi:hypothetical protein